MAVNLGVLYLHNKTKKKMNTHLKNFKQAYQKHTGLALTLKAETDLIEALKLDCEEALNDALVDALEEENTHVDLAEYCVFPEKFERLLPKVKSVETDKMKLDVDIDFGVLNDFVDETLNP